MKSDEVLGLNYGDIQIPEGLQFLVKGYAEYAKEVVIDRAIPNIDGFKPSQRRILYTMKRDKITDMHKSGGVVGAVLKLHPHGDQSVYDTLVRMVDSAEYMNIPFIQGKGSFGKVYSNEPPAAMRYTNVKLAPVAEELFAGMDGVNFVPSEDTKYMEPELLPVSFPTILCNATSGIAVGIASNIPSFNFHEVNNAVIELIETGKISKPLVPDFTSKGYYVYDENELRKIMERGKGRIKLRGKWHIEGKTIIIDEIPYYTKVNTIMKQIKDIPGIADIRDESDRSGLRLAIECSSKKHVDYVLTEILKNSHLQMTVTTNITVIIDNKPRVIGVTELLKEWVKFRTNVLEKTLKKEYEAVLEEIAQYEVLVDLLSDETKRDTFVTKLTKENEGKAREYLRELYPKVEDKVFTWILGLSLKSLSGVAGKASRLENLRKRKVELEEDLKNIPGVIVRQLRELNMKYSFPRRTEITTEDFVFEEEKQVVVKAEATPCVVVVDGKFIKKMRLNAMTENVEGIKCMSDDVLSFIDTKGRLLRVNLDNLEFMPERAKGVYLPVYLEIEDDFDVVAYEIVRPKVVGYMYSDGFASVVDYSEWVDSKRLTRITTNGVSPYASLIIGEIDLEKPYMLLFTKAGRFGFFPTDFKRKHRTARTKVVNVPKDDEIVSVVSVSYQDIMKIVTNPQQYMGRLRYLEGTDKFNSEYLSTLT